MKRWHQRVRRDRIDADDLRDSFFAFTQSCYHLVDWLATDKTRPIRLSETKKFVASTPVLAACCDICNGSKHAVFALKKTVNVATRPVRLGQTETVWGLSVEYQGRQL